MVVQDQYLRLLSPLNVNNAFPASHSLGAMNYFGEMYRGN